MKKRMAILFCFLSFLTACPEEPKEIPPEQLPCRNRVAMLGGWNYTSYTCDARQTRAIRTVTIDGKSVVLVECNCPNQATVKE
jgi:hypothetical protein